MTPTIGRIVHFRAKAEAPCQAATVVKAWSPETVNLVVFRDGTNDRADGIPGADLATWRTSVTLEREDSQGPTWHWPEREEG